MGCERGRGALMASLRSSMERRRVSNAKVTAMRHKKYQDLSLQREEEKIRKAREALERRKRERDRLNAYMHSTCPPAKLPDPFKTLQKSNMEEIYKKPPWTASPGKEYETLIKLREKNIAVANLRLECHQKQPHYDMYYERKEPDTQSGGDEPFLLNGEAELHHDALEPNKSVHTTFTGKSSHVQSELDDLEYELYALKTEMTECHTNVGRSHYLQMEPTVFGEHSLNSLRPVSRCLPPKAPSPRMSKTALRSCLKSSNDNQSFFAHPPETPRAQIKETRDRISSVTLTSTSGSDTNSNCDTPSPSMPPTPHSRPISMKMQSTNSKIISSREHCHIRNVEMVDDPFQVEAKDTVTGLSIQHLSSSRPTSIENADLKERVSKPQRTSPRFSEPNAVTPSWTDQLQDKRSDTFSCSSRDKVGLETSSIFSSENGTLNSKSVTPTLPPRYASTSPSWQEDGDLQTPSWGECEECLNPSLLTPSDKSQDKTETSVKDILITSLDSEGATTRLIAEVIAVQSRLEDCKLKPLDFREYLTEPVHSSRIHSRLKYHPKNETTSCVDSCEMTSQHGQAYESFKRGQALPEVDNSQDHATDVRINFDDDSLRDLNLDTNFMAERKTAASARSTGDYAESVATKEQRTGQSGKKVAQGVSQEETRARIEEFSQEASKKNEGGICRSTDHSNPKLDAEWSGTKSNEHSSPFLQPPSPTPITSLSSAGPDTCAASHIEICRPLSTTHDQIPQTKSVLLQTDFGMDHYKEIPHLAEEEISETLEDPQFESSVNKKNISDRSLMSTERTSKYLNLGYRDLTETPRSRLPKLHCFYSSQGLIETGYSQSRNGPATPPSEKKPVPQDNRHHRIYAYNDSSGDKENYGICGPDDQELSILASLERLDWKLAAISARAMSRTHPTPSVVSQGQGSTKSAPAVVGENVVPSERRPTPRKPPTNPLRPSSAKSQKPLRNLRHRRIVGVTNKFQSNIYHLYP